MKTKTIKRCGNCDHWKKCDEYQYVCRCVFTGNYTIADEGSKCKAFKKKGAK